MHGAYILRRLLLMIPTLFGIMVINFFIVQAAPGGPVEQMIAQIQGTGGRRHRALHGAGGGEVQQRRRRRPGPASGGPLSRRARPRSRAHQAASSSITASTSRAYERFFMMMKQLPACSISARASSATSSVVDLVLEKMPVSISLGLWTTLLIYLISIPLGIAKAVRDGSRFDVWTVRVVIVGNAIPGFLFAILLIVLFAGGSYCQVVPAARPGLRRLERALSWPAQDPRLPLAHGAADRALVIGGFASLTMLTKNSFLEEINKQYVLTARAKGLIERRVLYGHVFRNAMLIVIAGFPAAFIGMLFTGSLLIEVIFSLDGLGLLGFEAAINRDYPVMFGTLYFFGAARPGDEADRGPDLHVRRSAHRLRDAGGLMATPGVHQSRARARLLGVPLRLTRSTSAGSPTSAPTGAAARRSGSSSCCSWSACSPS